MSDNRGKKGNVRVTVWLPGYLVRDLKDQANAMKWSLSEVIRFLLASIYPLLHPDACPPLKKVIEVLPLATREDGRVCIWKLVNVLTPEAYKEIESVWEEMQRNGKE